REAAAEVVADEIGEPIAGEGRVVDERVPDRVEVLAAMGASERQRQRLVGSVVVDRAAGPDAVLADELRAGAEVGRPVAVERRDLVGALAARDANLGAAEAMGEEVLAEQPLPV